MDMRTLHSEAMDHAERAIINRARGDFATARKELADALRKEEAAARLAIQNLAPEPTRSILLKSAAHLAIDSGELRLAEQLIATALAGEPPEELAHELRAMFEEVGFHRHLDLRGIELQNNDLQMVLVGAAIAPGMVASDEFVGRVKTMQSLIYRTSESDQEVVYRERGDPKQQIERPLQLFVSVPRAASFAVSLKVASEKDQSEFVFAESAAVLDALLRRLEMFEKEDFESLHREIPKNDYFDNFIKLASDLAPDGNRVRMVGFTAQRGGSEKHVALKRTTNGEGKGNEFVPSREPRWFNGKLFYYNENNEGTLTVKLRAVDGTELRLKADTHLLTKVIKYVGHKSGVKILGKQTSKTTLEFEDVKVLRPIQSRKKGRKPR